MDSNNVAVMVPPQFAEFMQEFFGDKRGVLSADGNILSQSFALDSSFTMREIDGINGDFLYADSDSTGFMYVKLNGLSSPWLPIRPNFAITGFPIRKAWVRSTTAQAGKQINLYWGYGARIIPPNQDITSIGSITNPIEVQQYGRNPANYFSSTSVAGGAENIVAAGSNVNGLRVDHAQGYIIHDSASSDMALSVLCKASAPGTIVDGNVYALSHITPMVFTTLVLFGAGISREIPTRFASGLRLDYFTRTAGIRGAHSCAYDIL